MKKYKIAFLGLKGVPATSGADRVVECLLEHLSRRYDITVYCKKGYVDLDLGALEVNRVFIPTIPIKNLDMVFYFILSSLHACFLRRYDVLHVHNIDCAFILPLLRMSYRSRFISTSHGSPYEREKWTPLIKRFFRYMEAKFMRYSDLITSVSAPLQQYYEKRYGKKVEYIPNGVNFNEPAAGLPASVESASPVVKSGGYILFAAGRILPSKGCHIFLKALNGVDYQGGAVVVGDLSQMPEYTEQLRSMARPDVEFLGFIRSKEELMGIVKRAKLFVFPSTYEAASMMLLETVSQGVPVIVSDIPENKSLLTDPGFTFFRSGDADDLRIKIIWALDNYDRVLKNANALRNIVFGEYSWARIADDYSRLYDRMMLNH